jgi:Tol biopolymer transport system component
MPRLYETLRTAKAPGAQRLLNASLVIVAFVLFSRPADGQNTLAQRADEHPNIWKIAFERTRVRSSLTFQAILTDIYVMDSDGSHEQKLTHTGLCHRPNWSPDGSQVLFLCLNDNSELPTLSGGDEPDQEIGVTDSAGQNPRLLKPGVRIFGEPSWLPDGKTIAFGNVRYSNPGHKMEVSDRRIYTMTVDRAETPHSMLQGVSEADWSPDGRKLAYVTYRNNKENPAIYVANADGSDEHLLTDPKVRAYSLSWSLNSTRIAFTRWHGNRHIIGVADLQSGQFVELTPRNLDAFGPKWSQDGRRIAFSAFRSERTQVFLINADRTGLRQLSNEKEKDCDHPSWSPDGSQIVFECHTRMFYGSWLTNTPSILLGPMGTMPPAAQIYLTNVNAPNALPVQLTHTGGSNPRFYPVPASPKIIAGN